MVRLINYSIPKDAQCPLKCRDNPTTHPYEALGHYFVGFTIGLNFFPRSSLVADLNGKRKGGGEVDTSPIEYAKPDPSK